MKPSQWPDWLDDIWAKSCREGEMMGESLATHTWNVLERFTELVQLRPGLALQFNAPNMWHCLFWSCFLHDFGKGADGFQKMLRGGERWKHRHEVLSQTEQKWVLAAIVSHHRD